MINAYLYERHGWARKELEKTFQQTKEAHKLDIMMQCTTGDSDELYKCIVKNAKQPSIYIISVLASKSGIDLAKRIRAFDPKGQIIILLSLNALKAFFPDKVRPLGYVHVKITILSLIFPAFSLRKMKPQLIELMLKAYDNLKKRK